MSLPPTPPPTSKPTLTFEHPAMGSFVADDALWTSKFSQGKGASIELSLAGTSSGPYDSLVNAASALVSRFPEIKAAALDFLTEQEDAPGREDFICQGMELLREDSPNHFSLSFVLFGDDGGIWRVEFEDGEPEFITRDD